ncbi:MAG: hypothetical protein EA369_02590 [Bradymonadales bacterium]|nr:MAG: hypothetical protein EA369_02590 [Bradymonadales bacterium]
MRHAFLLALVFSLVGCASRPAPEADMSAHRKTFVESQLTPSELFLHTEQYLQWMLGYNIRLRDEDRGLLVTDWVMDDPHLRHQLSLRVNQGLEQASLLTANFTVQELRGDAWVEIPSGGEPEEDLLVEIEEQVRRIEIERFQ